MRAQALVLGAMLVLASCNDVSDAARADAAAVPQFAAATAVDLVSEGERVARVLGCFGCHGSDLQGAVWDDEPGFGIIAPSNLTRSSARYSDDELEHMIREGVRPDNSVLWEMPSEAFTKLSNADMKAVLAYLNASQPAGPERPRPKFGAGGREEIEQGLLLSAPQRVAQERPQEPWQGGGQHDQGRYVAQTACGECHGPTLSGNDMPYRPNLIVAANYSKSDFTRLMRTGQSPGGRDLGLMAMVAKSRFSHLTDEEVEAIYRYLVARAESL